MNGTVPTPTPTDADAAKASHRPPPPPCRRPETYTASWRCDRALQKLHKECRCPYHLQGHGHILRVLDTIERDIVLTRITSMEMEASKRQGRMQMYENSLVFHSARMELEQ